MVILEIALCNGAVVGLADDSRTLLPQSVQSLLKGIEQKECPKSRIPCRSEHRLPLFFSIELDH